jgi:nicotinamide phosphoribosyltransferase
MLLKAYLTKPITVEEIQEAKALWQLHGLPFNEAGWQHIVDKHGGYLPLKICAVPEGSLIPTRHVMVTIENTDPACYWLSTYFETILLQAVWYPTTVATISFHLKQLLSQYHQQSSDRPLTDVDFKLHDFGFRGVSSIEGAAIGGLAHLTCFKGSDTVPAILQARRYYGCEMASFSIPAAEHTTMTAWGKNQEEAAYRNMLQQFDKPGATLAVVSDSYDIYHAIDVIWGQHLKADVLQAGGTVVIRPDSGDPTEMPITAIQGLMKHYGYRINQKGYKVLPDSIRVIHSDGLTPEVIRQILVNMAREKLSLDNLFFGMGAALLQLVNRDTQKFAMKCSAVCRDGHWHSVYKDPVTDKGKRSKAGRLALIQDKGQYFTIQESELAGRANLLIPVYTHGKLLVDDNLETIRQRIQTQIRE